MYTARGDSLLGTMRFVSRQEYTKVYGAILPKLITNQAMLDSVAYKTYYAIASGAKPPKLKKTKTKCDSAISYEETPSKKKPTKSKKDVPSKKKPTFKPKLTKKKAPVKADRGKASGLGDGTNFESWVPGEQQRKTSGANEGTDDEDEDYTKDDEGNDDGDDSDGNDDVDNDGDDDNDNDDDNDGNDDDDSDHERTKSDRDENPDLNQFNEEHEEEEEEEENVDEFTDKEDDKENEEESDDGEELYKDVNVNLSKEDVEMTDADQGVANQQNVSQESSSSVSFDFIEKLLNFENVSPADNEIASLMDTTVHTKEPSGQTSTLFTVPITVILTTIPPPPHFFNPFPQ
ncbi:hypothetical protein Tco_1334049 [Tanacetum coccineum]